ncbi:YjjG family noncanonical pyrimidine nucleotidase [Oscillibacter sp. 1-3]|uniref:YjjG family noncanonical pyrimidine nucleotidase n=1 Tax=Oscillibacter sp. 1-3 TaxID=1235797 RepID=UPI000336F83D|nr:YjjG family noncanonical pyrimidine nucleotidase [Oscillibacter sp. 1-3]EOS66797.1 TIGR02254 family HAD hydrolase [Oscillibacter sp. 1-3]
MLKTVFLDLDDTILDFARAEAAALRRALTEADVPVDGAVLARYHAINAAQWELLEEGALTREQVLLGRFDILFGELGLVRPAGEICRRYEEYLGEGHWFIPGAEALLEALAPRYDLYLASNGTAEVQYRRLESAGIRRYFRGIFISRELGADKPSSVFFERCFAAVPGFSRACAVMVGDSLTSDIRGGRDAGLRTCWFNPHGKPTRADIVPDYEVSALEQLPALLETL